MKEDLELQADVLLAEIRKTKGDLEALQDKYGRLVAILTTSAKTKAAPLKAHMEDLEKRLKKLGKDNRDELFTDGDRLALEHGDLILQEGERVVRAKAVTVEVIEAQGWPEGVKITKAVDWDVVSAWPDERLAAIGTERKKCVDVSYELPEA